MYSIRRTIWAWNRRKLAVWSPVFFFCLEKLRFVYDSPAARFDVSASVERREKRRGQVYRVHRGQKGLIHKTLKSQDWTFLVIYHVFYYGLFFPLFFQLKNKKKLLLYPKAQLSRDGLLGVREVHISVQFAFFPRSGTNTPLRAKQPTMAQYIRALPLRYTSISLLLCFYNNRCPSGTL